MTRSQADHGARWWRRVLSVLGAAIGLAALGWLLRGLDYDRLGAILASADPAFLLLVPLAVVVEQLVRAWKWGRLLDVLRGIDT